MALRVEKAPLQILSMAKSNRSGFTALELSVVVTMLAIFVTLVLPNLVSQQATERDRAFKVTLNRLAIQAREGAITDNRIYHLAMDGEQKIVLRKEDDNGDPSTSDPVASIDIPDGTSPNEFMKSGKASNVGDFDVLFYPDGTSDTGGIVFQRGQDTYALNIDAKAHGEVDDALTDTTVTTWDAGTYEQR